MRSSTPPRLPRGGVEAKAADLEHGRSLLLPAAREGAQARGELGEREWLRQVVVGAAVEARHAVVHGVARGEQEDGRPDAVVTQPAARLEAVDAREHHVEDHGVVRSRGRHPQSVLAAPRHVHRGALLSQAAAHQRRHLHVILDDQQTHSDDHDTAFMRVP